MKLMQSLLAVTLLAIAGMSQAQIVHTPDFPPVASPVAQAETALENTPAV